MGKKKKTKQKTDEVQNTEIKEYNPANILKESFNLLSVYETALKELMTINAQTTAGITAAWFKIHQAFLQEIIKHYSIIQKKYVHDEKLLNSFDTLVIATHAYCAHFFYLFEKFFHLKADFYTLAQYAISSYATSADKIHKNPFCEHYVFSAFCHSLEEEKKLIENNLAGITNITTILTAFEKFITRTENVLIKLNGHFQLTSIYSCENLLAKFHEPSAHLLQKAEGHYKDILNILKNFELNNELDENIYISLILLGYFKIYCMRFFTNELSRLTVKNSQKNSRHHNSTIKSLTMNQFLVDRQLYAEKVQDIAKNKIYESKDNITRITFQAMGYYERYKISFVSKLIADTLPNLMKTSNNCYHVGVFYTGFDLFYISLGNLYLQLYSHLNYLNAAINHYPFEEIIKQTTSKDWNNLLALLLAKQTCLTDLSIVIHQHESVIKSNDQNFSLGSKDVNKDLKEVEGFLIKMQTELEKTSVIKTVTKRQKKQFEAYLKELETEQQLRKKYLLKRKIASQARPKKKSSNASKKNKTITRFHFLTTEGNINHKDADFFFREMQFEKALTHYNEQLSSQTILSFAEIATIKMNIAKCYKGWSLTVAQKELAKSLETKTKENYVDAKSFITKTLATIDQSHDDYDSLKSLLEFVDHDIESLQSGTHLSLNDTTCCNQENEPSEISTQITPPLQIRKNIPIDEFAMDIYNTIKEKFLCYLVGGAVRDFFLDQPTNNYNYISNATIEELQALFPWQGIRVGDPISSLSIECGHIIIQISTFNFNTSMTLEQALFNNIKNRDLTINALIYDPEKRIVYDFKNGIDDIHNKKLTLINNVSLENNILRIIRFSAQLNWLIPEDIIEQIKESSSKLIHLKPKHLFAEISKLFFHGYCEQSVLILQKLNIFPILFPGSSQYLMQKTDNLYPLLIDKVFKRLDQEEVLAEKHYFLGLSILLWGALQLQLSNHKDIELAMNNAFKQECTLPQIPQAICEKIKTVWRDYYTEISNPDTTSNQDLNYENYRFKNCFTKEFKSFLEENCGENNLHNLYVFKLT